MKQKVLLVLLGFLLLSPGISYTIRTFAQDSLPPDTTPIVTDDTYEQPALVYVLEVEGAIGIVTEDRISEAIDLAVENNAELIVVEMDTPGGFMQATQGITKLILNSPVPVCTYVAPSGSRAGSAGVFITYASHFAAMAPSTNIGAAHPVTGQGQEVDSVMNQKVTNDAVAQVKAAAQRHGRNVEWAEKAVRQSVSITDVEALEMNVIDFRARSLNDLLEQIDGQEALMADDTRKVMRLEDYTIKVLEKSFKDKVLGILSSPDVAFILFSLGGLGIVLELYNPGSIFPGVVGAICLILAFYSFNTLPINYAGVALILLAIVLFVAEIKIASAGLLTIGGLVSLFLGGLMLIDSVNPALQVSKTALITIVVLVGLVVAVVARLVIKAQQNKPFSGDSSLVGRQTSIKKPGFVYLEGALWRIDDTEQLEPGTKVEVIGVDGLTLKVRKLEA
ncbi:nodulation protein NfeD [candidate division GN15 bacterium]|nr:nodulation protein NfeD [candidate division GN15 bacterium]